MSTDLATLSPDVAAVLRERLGSEAWLKINSIDAKLSELPQQECPLHHTFTPGLYTRTIFMPAGSLVTSRIHLHEHPFAILQGKLKVWTDEGGWIQMQAPFIGVTKAGTRRVLFIEEDTIWATFHVTDKTDPDAIVEQVTFDHPTALGYGQIPLNDSKLLEELK